MLYVEVICHFNEHKLISKFLQNYFGINLGPNVYTSNTLHMYIFICIHMQYYVCIYLSRAVLLSYVHTYILYVRICVHM